MPRPLLRIGGSVGECRFMLAGVPVRGVRLVEDKTVVVFFERCHVEGLVHGPANTSVFSLSPLPLLLER